MFTGSGSGLMPRISDLHPRYPVKKWNILKVVCSKFYLTRLATNAPTLIILVEDKIRAEELRGSVTRKQKRLGVRKQES